MGSRDQESACTAPNSWGPKPEPNGSRVHPPCVAPYTPPVAYHARTLAVLPIAQRVDWGFSLGQWQSRVEARQSSWRGPGRSACSNRGLEPGWLVGVGDSDGLVSG